MRGPPAGGQVQHKESAMMNNGAWFGMGGGMWIWTVIGVLVVVLLVIVITKLSNKKS